MEVLIICLGLIAAIIVIIYVVRKIFPVIAILTILFLISMGVLNYYDYSLKDIYGYSQVNSIVKSFDGSMNFDKDEKKLSVDGKGYNLSVQKFDDGTEIYGESSLLDEKATESMLGLFSTSIKVFGGEELLKEDLTDIDTGEVLGGIVEVLQDESTYNVLLESMKSSGNVLESGKFKMYVKDDKLKLEKEK